ncbi:alpha/beta hydrolase [Propionibacterium sp.]|uniref:alpha/beta hydrolase n=1 Tax=Propionibacterium sp. TaxID=1977903 RepID=UPI0039ED5717
MSWRGEDAPVSDTSLMEPAPPKAPEQQETVRRMLSCGPTMVGLSGTGLTLALAMSWVALSPSLLPRTWWATAGSVGLSMTLGYLVGTLLQRLWVRLSRALRIVVTIDPRWGRRLRIAWIGLLVVGTLNSWIANYRRQVGLERLVGVPAAPLLTEALGLVIGVLIFVLLLCTGLLIAALWRWTTRHLSRLLTDWIAPILATALIVGAAFAVAQGVIIRPVVESVYSAAAETNRLPWQNRSQPSESTRSGSPSSFEAWDTLGAQGQAVVADGPRAAEISGLTGAPAMDPIRVYAGLVPGRGMDATAEAVVQELDRTHAWDRQYLLVATGVGGGWVDEWTLESIEYMTHGDCAAASMQYSYLSSGAAFILDRSSPTEAGRALWSAVRARWNQLPVDHRPKLLASGESLGSYGGQAAFADPQDLLDQVTGAVWVGTPSFTPLWRQFTDSRRQGSPEVAPVIDNGKHVRFITSPDELNHDYFGGTYVPWTDPKIVYLQHASDPVVWWSVDLIWHEPDWMREGVGRDVVSSVRWIPWVSFWQIGFDVPAAINAPPGHGHQYTSQVVPVWNAVLGHPVNDAEVVQIQTAIQHDEKRR